MKSIFVKIAGVALLLLGIAGLFLPFLQGILLIFIGLSLLSPPLAARLRRMIFLRFHKGPFLVLEEWSRLGARAGWTVRTFPVVLHQTDDLLDLTNQAGVSNFLNDPVGAIHESPLRFAFLKQTHGNGVSVVGDAAPLYENGPFQRFAGDALVTTERGTALLALSADCLPIFYTALRDGKAVAVAVAHAGWRGTKERIAARTLERIKEISGARDADIRVAFGPSIDFRHYEVGEEFQQYFPGSVGLALQTVHGKWHFDLRMENLNQLIAAGLTRNPIVDTGFSTVAHNRFFYSFRLEKNSAGRTVSFIWLR